MCPSSSPSTHPAFSAPPPLDAVDEWRDDDFWRRLPGYADVDRATFLDHRWQVAQSVDSVDRLFAVVGSRLERQRRSELVEGLRTAPMTFRLTPYLISLIDWQRFDQDPLRRQYLPVYGERQPDHPCLRLDSLEERRDSPVPGLTHRHPDAVLFVVLDRCPVYCRFCTRSYSIGQETETTPKERRVGEPGRWQQGLDYIRRTPQVEDVVLSGGDLYLLKPEQVRALGRALLDIAHVRRLRMATKGPAILPMKLLTDDDWVMALTDLAAEGRRRQKQVALHTHFSHPQEITAITRDALGRLFQGGVTLRNQGVLLRGVNDDAETLRELVRRLGRMNVLGYYLYQQDMVPGVEDLRTPLSRALELEKQVRGATAGFHTPTFVVDLPGGGGKRDVHSFEWYDRETGISAYRSPNVDADALYLYFDPLHSLSPAARTRWAEPGQREAMIRSALARAP